MQSARILSWLVCSSMVSLAVAQDAAPRLRWIYRPAVPVRIDPQAQRPDRVIVKFAEHLRVRPVAGRLVALDGEDLGAVRAWLAPFRVERLFSRAIEDLDEERAALQGRVPAGEPPLADLNNYYRVTTGGEPETVDLVTALLGSPLVETAYPELVPVLIGDIPPPTPLFESGQTYLGPAPQGYEYLAVESIVGARGTGLELAQLEGKWTLDHEDIPLLTAASIVGNAPTSSYNSWENHGTACVGLMVAGRNDYGVRGMGSDAGALWVSSLSNGAANMISLVTAKLDAGDVMSSSFAWVINSYHAPVDYPQSSFDAVRVAAAKGIHYTFGAGNTGVDLGNTSIYGSRYLPTSASSGGYIIGATGAGNLAKAGFSNYGTRVDANGWGGGVTTTGYGALFDPNDIRQRYTSGFGGTSAAGPAVAGVIAAYVGAVAEQNGQVLDVATVHTDLRATGTAVSGTIGTRPDLLALLAARGLPDGLIVGQHGQVGGTFRIDVSGPAGTPYGLLLSFARGNVAVGANRPVLIDPAQAFAAGGGTLDAGGAGSVGGAVPNDPTLAGLDLFFQAAQARPAGLHLSNSVMLWVRM